MKKLSIIFLLFSTIAFGEKIEKTEMALTTIVIIIIL